MASNIWSYLGLAILGTSFTSGQRFGARLVTSDHMGRLEVTFNGMTGTVCDDHFDDVDALVACRMLGYTQGIARLANGGPAPFGEGTGIIGLDDLGCLGTESNLADCPHAGWNQSNCNHAEDVGVECTGRVSTTTTGNGTTTTTGNGTTTTTGNGTTTTNTTICPAGGVLSTDVRLYGTQNGFGIVEIRNTRQGAAFGEWGTICDDNFGVKDAMVICRMLCGEASVPYARSGAQDNAVRLPRLPIRLDNIECAGTEQDILNCQRSAWGVNDCDSSTEAARVTCVPQEFRAPAGPVPTMTCTGQTITAVFNRSLYPNLEDKHLSPKDQSFPCNVQKRTTSTIASIGMRFDECGTIKELNATHIIYKNIISIGSTSIRNNVIKVNTYLVHVACEFNRSGIVDKGGIQPLSENATHRAPGKYHFEMLFYRHDNFTQAETVFPVRVTLGEVLNVKVVLIDVETGLKLIVPGCRASPRPYPASTITYPLIVDRCPDDPDLAIYPWTRTSFAFRFKTFKFVGNYPLFYVICDTFVCAVHEKNSNCDQTCTNPLSGRRKRSAFDASHPLFQVSTGPLQLVTIDQNNNNEQNNAVVSKTQRQYQPNEVLGMMGGARMLTAQAVCWIIVGVAMLI